MKTIINNISVTPVKKYTAPKYPTKIETVQTPGLLKKLPTNWEKNVAVIAAVGMLGAMSLTSCRVFESDTETGRPSPTSGENPGQEIVENLLNVAPIFLHGSGTGSIGCDMVAPPVFLSEQEALAIIKSVAETEGLTFGDKPPEYTATKNEIEARSNREKNYILGNGNIGLDLYDDEKGVAVTYISMEAAEQIYHDGPWSSATLYAPRELAELTAEDFAAQQGDITIGVFYDPNKSWESEEHQKIFAEYNNHNSEKSWEERVEQYKHDVKLLIEENLRAQVRDFIEWLQGQGII